jgi:acetoin utilization protein AcuB
MPPPALRTWRGERTIPGMTVKKPDRIPPVMAVMTPFPWFVQIEDRLERARELMREHGIRHLPVTQGGELVGVVSSRDIQLVESAADSGERDRLRVRDACVQDAYVADLAEPLDRVLLEMARRHIDSTLVTRNRKLVGILTVTDACRAFGGFLQAMFPHGDDNEAA